MSLHTSPPSHRRSRRGRLALATVVVLAAGALAAPTAGAATPEAAAAAAPSTKRLHDDFNGDGYPDLAVGAPGTQVGTLAKAGAISVHYGSASGLSVSRKQLLPWRDRDALRPQTAYGSDLRSADLDRDGYADLVSTVQWSLIEGYDGQFLVVNWGGPTGLSATPTVLDRSGAAGYSSMRYGVGDVDGDKNPDLVQLAEEYGSDSSPGDGTVLRGPFTRDGRAAGARPFTVDPEGMSRFHSIAVGDVTGDGVADLAVGSTFVDESDSRAVDLLAGGPDGFTAKGILKDGQGRVIGGERIEIGDLNKDGYGDIVVGHSGDAMDSDVELPTRGGAVIVAYGGPNGTSATRKPVWINQDTAGVPGTGERGDGMGSGLSIGDTNGDGYPDVATGLPGEDLGGITDAGSVVVLRGGAGGLTGSGAKSFSQDTAGVPGTAEKADRFGAETALVDANGDRRHGLVAGAPAENAANGGIWIFSATTGGITASGSTTFGAGTVGLPATGARFGASLAD
ncbi:VCBS repeat-containing protein [Streptomyces sp. NPDC085946]|uniref:VCBS repeat-containing protein n=1 Tax=Streptomyces sp. NPDC085946 TaxID=3365744 RepID=UPI0037CDBCFD